MIGKLIAYSLFYVAYLFSLFSLFCSLDFYSASSKKVGYIIVLMENAPSSFPEFIRRPLIDEDLRPLYQLTALQFQSIINGMTNLLGEVAQRLAQADNTELARIVTEQGYEILMDYDPDVSEAIRWCAQPRRIDHSRLGQPRDVAPKLPELTIDLPFI